jgi:hypothetical protein
LYDEMGRRIGNEKEKQQECQQKRMKVQAKQSDNFRKSYQKFISNQPLAVADLRNLMNRVKLRDDSPLKTRSADLKQQWEKRKHRYDDFLPTPRSTGETGLIPVPGPPSTIVQPTVMTPEEQIIFGDLGSATNNFVETAEQIKSTSQSESQQI